MEGKLSKKEVLEHVEDGWILANVIFEIVGNPEEHVVNSLKGFMDNLKSDKEFIFLDIKTDDPAAVEGGLFATYANCDMLVRNLEKLTWLCINFMPASIDIIQPEELVLQEKDANHFFNNLLAHLHTVNQNVVAMRSDNRGFNQVVNVLAKNLILILLTYEKKMSIEQLQKKSGIEMGLLQKFIDALAKDRKLKKDGEQVSLV
ncbi:MAG: hypothetical protein H6502_01540 [Candidatus Woesearchaeota archaeon]|nr:MAG: hypothetical protein H6502_01540 [Candidatus Woesearchaeota archaeon]